MKKTCLLVGLIFLLLLLQSAYGQLQRISVHKKSQILKDEKKQTVEADCYYSAEKGIFIAHYFDPKEFIKITNREGELKIYFPDDNKVSIKQDFYFSSENELLHYFVNNLIDDLGLKKEGFSMTGSRYDEGYMITTWSAPQSVKAISKVEIVFEDMIPIYAAYFGKNGTILRKIYYSNYYKGKRFFLPRRITEITYVSENDSTIRRTLYSNIKKNDAVDPYYLNYEIPEDARIAK